MLGEMSGQFEILIAETDRLIEVNADDRIEVSGATISAAFWTRKSGASTTTR
ncbi:MAG: hypothetical protein ACLUEQ_06290 [Cloacibacillus evryensis]